MIILDIIALLLLLAFIYFGYKKGILIKFIWLFSIGFGFFSGLIFSPYINKLFGLDSNSVFIEILSFLVAFVPGFLLILITGKFIRKIVNKTFLKWLDSILGVFWGIIKYLVIISIIFWVLNYILPKDKKAQLYKTYTGKVIIQIYSFINFGVL